KAAAGDQQRLPMRFKLPADLKPGRYELVADVYTNDTWNPSDTFTINVLPRPAAVPATGKVALFDPKGDTAKLLAGMGVAYQRVDATADLTGFDVLVIGREALTTDGPGPDVS